MVLSNFYLPLLIHRPQMPWAWPLVLKYFLMLLPEYDSREWIQGARMMWGWHQTWQIMLQCLTQRRIKRQVRTYNMLLNPHIRPQTFNLLPQTVQILLLRMWMVGFEYSQGVVVDLFPALDVSLQTAQHSVKLTLFLLV